MESTFSLPILVLGELVLVLLFVLLFMWFYIRKQKAMLAKMVDKSHQLKDLFEQREREFEALYAHEHGGSDSSVPEYLAQGIEEAQQRYEKIAQGKLPKIDPDQAFNAKVAALRYVYLTSEKEVYEKGVNPASAWKIFEKKLADIVRWIAKQTTNRQSVRNNRNRLLQEKVDALKPLEAENKKLQHSLELSKKRQEQLEAYLRENKATIFSLQKTLNSLQHLGDSTATKTPSINDMSIEDYLAHSANRVETIGDLSQEKSLTIKNILYELNNTQSDFDPAIKKKMEASLKIMEIEMMKSDQYIDNLKNDLKDARMQATNYALMLRDNNMQKDTKSGLTVSNATTGFDLTMPKSLSHNDYLDQEKVVMEIRQLRENNKAQRGIIVNLEQEISLLKESIADTSDLEVRKVKQQEVNRLERMVKECEHCIETLESEVDHLYSQLQERTSEQTVYEDDNGFTDEPDIERLSRELEDMAKEMEKIMFQYRQTHAVNQLIYDLGECNNIEKVAKRTAQFFKEFNAKVGFSIVSTAGTADYFPDSLFNENVKELVKSFSFNEPIFYLNDGTIFSSSKLCLMLLRVTDDSKVLHESILSGLVRMTSDRVQYLESAGNSSARAENMESWIAQTKNHLADLDIQYAYQVEENKKTFNNFIAEIRQAYHLLDLKGSGLILLDNAINEYEQRMYLLLSSGDIIDREISTLINHIDNLKVH